MNQETAIRQLKELEKLGGMKEMRLAAEEWDEAWKTLISIIMSARTRDEVTIVVASRLFSKYKTVQKLAKANLKDVMDIIRPVNFYRNKSKSVVNCAKALVEKYGGDPPRDFNKLVELPGVGRKTANVFLSEFGGDAIGIDTHVHFISRKLGWTRHDKQKDIEKDLEELFPQKMWKEINPTLVRFGKSYISRKKKNEILDSIGRLK